MNGSFLEQWARALAFIQTAVGPEAHQRWFEPLRVASANDTEWCVEAPDAFFRDWFLQHHLHLLESTLGRRVRLVVAASPPEDLPVNAAMPTAAAPSANETARVSLRLNPRYTFDGFVVGPSNRFAHAACLAVAESPGKAYNPLFIYGGVGLGKTHLMQAIGHALSQRLGSTSACYLSSEQFTNQLIGAIQHRSMVKFRERYRTADVLLIDDIHFIAGKEATQEEFFHTFNTLHDAHKQIVISSDRSPKEIPGLEERLVSRFEWGLVTDIQAPDFETRVAILRRKAQEAGTMVPDDVAVFVAQRVKSNIRELEGALIRVVASAKFSGQQLSVALAHDVLGDMLAEESRRITLGDIEQVVVAFFGVSSEAMKGKSRERSVLYPRQAAMYLARTLTDHSLPEIGRWFGGRDHTTVLHAVARLRADLQTKPSKQLQLDQLALALRQQATKAIKAGV